MPSESDNDLTDRMIQVGKIVNIQVVDHLIISPDFYYSYQQSGLLSALEKSKKWVPPFQEEERIRKEALKIGKEAGLKEGKKIGLEKGMKKGRKEGKNVRSLEIAKKMKKKGESVETISEYTGLSKEEIEKL
jgi:DNA repair protein RadC